MSYVVMNKARVLQCNETGQIAIQTKPGLPVIPVVCGDGESLGVRSWNDLLDRPFGYEYIEDAVRCYTEFSVDGKGVYSQSVDYMENSLQQFALSREYAVQIRFAENSHNLDFSGKLKTVESYTIDEYGGHRYIGNLDLHRIVHDGSSKTLTKNDFLIISYDSTYNGSNNGELSGKTVLYLNLVDDVADYVFRADIISPVPKQVIHKIDYDFIPDECKMHTIGCLGSTGESGPNYVSFSTGYTPNFSKALSCIMQYGFVRLLFNCGVGTYAGKVIVYDLVSYALDGTEIIFGHNVLFNSLLKFKNDNTIEIIQE